MPLAVLYLIATIKPVSLNQTMEGSGGHVVSLYAQRETAAVKGNTQLQGWIQSVAQ